MRPVTLSPSVPASGESLTRNIIDKCRRIDRLGRQRLGDLGRAQRMRDGRLRQAGDRDDVAGDRLPRSAWRSRPRNASTLETRPCSTNLPLRSITLTVWLGFTEPEVMRPVTMRPRYGLASRMVPSMRNGPSSTCGGATWARMRSNSGAIDVLRAVDARRHPAFLGGAVEHRKVELLLGGIERREQVEHFAGHDVRAGVVAIDLVDGDDRPKPDLERLRHHELGLRQRPFGGIDQHDGAVHHVEDALDLAAEIGVARAYRRC